MADFKDYSRSVTEASDEVKDIFCEPCEQDGRKTDAEGFCVDCSEYLCGQCYKTHKLSKAFRNHVLQDKENMPFNSSGGGINDSCHRKCELHSDKVIEYYCGSCDKIGCTTCIILDHRQCKEVDHIPKIVKESIVIQEIETFLKKVDLISKQVKERQSTLKSMSGTTDNIRKMAKTELKTQRAEINKFFDKLEKEMDNKIDEIHTSSTTTIAAASKTYDTMDKDIAYFKTDISTKQKTGQHCEAFISMKHSVIDIDAIEKQFQSMQTESKILKYKLLPSSKINDMKEKVTEICRLETETVSLETNKPQATGIQQQPITTPSSTIQDIAQKTIKRSDASNVKAVSLSAEINISTSNDKECPSIWGLAVIHEHYIVVADYNNMSVKVINTRNKEVISEMNMEEKVRNVTNMKDDKIAVALVSKIQILFVSKTGLLSKDSDIPTKRTCYDVVYNNESLIVTQGSCVSIIDMQGNILKTFETNSSHERLFQGCCGLAISTDNETIYASDYAANTITSLTFDGHVKTIYRDNDLKHPWGISLDSEGNIYVCTKSFCIHQLSPDCTKLQVFKDIYGASITCTKTNKLIVGTGDVLKIYDIL